ncbi:hypothetical protein VM1G_11675 [Cytospora mali]|uniref:Uncharacterized protein n=1 Tax=Cytospora mali TaxID=578113 RepID=A0A194W3V5_CYTMA|nr:hypothetical protein VM1G_11675 [Valsa mali]
MAVLSPKPEMPRAPIDLPPVRRPRLDSVTISLHSLPRNSSPVILASFDRVLWTMEDVRAVDAPAFDSFCKNFKDWERFLEPGQHFPSNIPWCPPGDMPGKCSIRSILGMRMWEGLWLVCVEVNVELTLRILGTDEDLQDSLMQLAQGMNWTQ